MNPYLQTALDEIRGAWRFRWWALLTAVLVAGVGWAVVFAMPDRYEANAEVLVDSRTALKPALQGLAMEQDVGVQLNYVREALLADPQLKRIAQFAGVLPETLTDQGRQQALLKSIRKRVQITVQSTEDQLAPGNTGGTTYEIDYLDNDRARALKMVGILLSTLVNETLGGKRQGSENAQQFLESQIKDYEKRLRTAEDRLADFKSQHVGAMPTEQGGSFAQLQKETETLEDLKIKLITAESRRNTIEKELHGDSAIESTAPIIGPNGAVVGMDTVSRIAATQQRLDELLLKYTDKYPDVIATRRTLAELKKQRAAELEALRRGDANALANSGANLNPVFQSIQLALNNVEVEISDLQAEIGEHQAKARELRQMLDTAPQVEAEYAQLTRDYDVTKAQYTALQTNYEKARLGERADNAGSVRFAVVQPPTVSYKPVWPQRTLYLSAVLMLALGCAGGLAYALNQLQPVVVSAARLSQLTDVPVVGVVGPAFPGPSRALVHRQTFQIALALTAIVVVFFVLLALSASGLRLELGGGKYPG